MITDSAVPDVRGDHFTVGFEGIVPSFFDDPGASLVAAVGQLGKLTTPPSKDSDGFEQVTFALETTEGHPAGPLRIEIHGLRKDHDLLLTNRCCIQANGMLMLRGELGPDSCGLSLDGKRNVVGPQHLGPGLTLLQLPLFAQAVEYALDALTAAFPKFKPGGIWLKRAEGCRDLQVAGAITATRILQHATLCGAVERRWDAYHRTGGIEVSDGLTLRFIANKSSPQYKIYAKCVDVLRLEIVCHDRDSFKEFTGKKRFAFNIDGARLLFLDFLTTASPRLDVLEAHVRAALDGEASVVALLVALKSLIDRACGERKARGPASPDAQRHAERAIEHFLSVGMFDAGGIDSNHAIRLQLDALLGPDGPLDKHEHRAIYYLKPRYARACAVIRMPETD